MRTLFLTQTGELGPSSRYRVYQLLPHLEELGVECVVSPAIDDTLYRELYLDPGTRHGRAAAFRAAWQHRKVDLQRVDEFDVIVVQKGVFPGLYSGWEKQFAARKPLVFDFDDAIWLPRVGGSRVLRALHRETPVQDVLRCSAAVIAGNSFLAEYASRFNRNVTIAPSSVPVESVQSTTNSSVVGWIGSRTTLPYLKLLRPAFEALQIIPRVIASGNSSQLGFDVDFRPWRLETENEELSQIGIGISPLPDTPWERGKCGVKLLQYMSYGIPVIASPVGVNRDIVTHGVNGILAAHIEEWTMAIRDLVADSSLRQRLGAAGRETVTKRFTIQRAAETVASILHSLV